MAELTEVMAEVTEVMAPATVVMVGVIAITAEVMLVRPEAMVVMVEVMTVTAEAMLVRPEDMAKAGAEAWVEGLEWAEDIGALGTGKECLAGFVTGGNSRNMTNPGFLSQDR